MCLYKRIEVFSVCVNGLHVFLLEMFLWLSIETFLAFSWFQYQNLLKTFLANFIRILMYCVFAQKYI